MMKKEMYQLALEIVTAEDYENRLQYLKDNGADSFLIELLEHGRQYFLNRQ